MKKSKATAILVLIIACLAGLCYYASLILSSTGIGETMSIPLGLDLSGGVSITYQVMDEDPTAEEMSDTRYKLQQRVAATENTESAVYQVGDDRITVEIPGAKDPNAILAELGNPGTLEFRTLDGTVFMTGDHVAKAVAGTMEDQYGAKMNVVALTLTDEGAEIFAKVTAENVGLQLPIVYDGEVISSPEVKEAITGGQAQITGMDTFAEAESIAANIRIGSLSLELQELESSIVGASLGSEAISSSLKAAAIGLLLVMIFMIIMYRISGVAASLALVGYTTLVIATLYLFEITLTLPGIAGIILGIGMAVDANVIIFARIREEIATGKTVQSSMKIGFQKATSAIVDGNITTFIAAIVLMMMGTGTVKGFAYTLMIGIIISMFTALCVTRWILYAFYGLGLKDEKFYGRAKERKNFNFIGRKAVFFAISFLMIGAGIVAMVLHQNADGKALNYGLDFVGGTSTTADFNEDYSIEEIEKEIIPAVVAITGDSNVQANKIEGTTQITIKTRNLSLEERDAINDMMVSDFGVDETTVTSQSISSTISSEMRADAIKAVVVACICMLIYIWFRFDDIRFAASAIAALVHDVLVVLTVYAIVRVSVGNTFIACMLTIIGYSVNDTIVIFDRIRENLKNVVVKRTPEVLAEVANKSLTQTLSRSINTSITTFIMVVMLYVLGVASIREFALPLMAGLICGAYSSVCIATQLWYVLRVRFEKREEEE